jgi:hypothetical protein
MIPIAKETPHMFMWFSDGSKIPPGISPLPQNSRLDYIKRLKEECRKLLFTNTPVYLVYMGRLLNREQITLLADLQNEISNLAVIDYDEVETRITDESVTSKVAAAASAYREKEKLDVGHGGIADLVDFTRLILLYNSNILRDIAQTKITIPLEWREGLIYRDFDVTLEKEAMVDIPTTNGHMATLNFSEKVRGHHTHLIELAHGEEDLTRRIDVFFNTYIYNLEQYQQIIPLFLNRSLTTEERKAKQALISEYQKICREDNFELVFIQFIRIENSFLAINTDQNRLIKKMIQEAVLGESPYAVVQLNFKSLFNRLTLLKEFLTPQLLGFNIGNDLTWKMGIREQHTSENSTTIDSQLRRNTSIEIAAPLAISVTNTSSPPLSTDASEGKNEREEQVTVDKLSKLSKNYLTHLNKASNKNNFQDKYKLMLELNTILDNLYISPSTKLLEFSNRLQEEGKGILKNHREPHWVMCKR